MAEARIQIQVRTAALRGGDDSARDQDGALSKTRQDDSIAPLRVSRHAFLFSFLAGPANQMPQPDFTPHTSSAKCLLYKYIVVIVNRKKPAPTILETPWSS